ncbi:P-type conjugative transfer protein TrbG, partial [Salmonella enterica subsp. enterica serovar Enteritidis]|nr:P-type conjugative transfer protein TrbG [Salmonella enterica subsp. enterica serovar Enteritidis]
GLFSKATEKLVNYRPIGDRYVVDKVLDRASLIVGVGRNQTEVTITRTGGK